MIDGRGDAAVAARAGASLREVEPASAVSSKAAIPIAKERPHLSEFAGPMSVNGSYKIQLFSIGPLRAQEVRNVIKVLELSAGWLGEDEASALAQGIVSREAIETPLAAQPEGQEPGPPTADAPK